MSEKQTQEKVKEKLERFCVLKTLIKEYTEELESMEQVVEQQLLDSQDNKLLLGDYTLELRKSSTYDYESSGHPQYNAIKSTMEKLNLERKKIEAMLQNVPQKGVQYKLKSGDSITLTPPNKTNKNKIYFKKK